VSPANVLDWRRDLAGTGDHLTAMEWWDVNLVGRDEPERAGREVRYRVVGAELAAVARRLEVVGVAWDRRLAAVKEIAEGL
jgi:hypothetical protein